MESGVAQFTEIVDLAIEDDDEALVGTGHGLMAVRREVEDREAAVAEGDAGVCVYPCTLVIGTARDDGVGHATDGGRQFVGGRAAWGSEETGDAAHGLLGSWLELDRMDGIFLD